MDGADERRGLHFALPSIHFVRDDRLGPQWDIVAGTDEVDRHPQSFVVGDNVYWTLRAPSTRSGPDEVLLRIDAATAVDENNAQGALIALGQGTIPIVTEGAAVKVANVSGRLGLETKVVPGGATDVRKLGFTLTYEVTDTLVSDASIDTIAVSVLGSNGNPLSDGNVRNTLRRVFTLSGRSRSGMSI